MKVFSPFKVLRNILEPNLRRPLAIVDRRTPLFRFCLLLPFIGALVIQSPAQTKYQVNVVDHNITYNLNQGCWEESTPTGGPWDFIYPLVTNGEEISYFRIFSSSSDQRLYKRDGSTLEDITPDGGPWFTISSSDPDGQGNNYFNINSSSSDQNLYKSDGNTFVDITPDGGPWRITSIGTDGQGNSYFEIYSRSSGSNNRRLYKNDGSTMEDITPNGSSWSGISSLRTDGAGNSYFETNSSSSGKKLYKSDGSTLIDMTPDGGPWTSINYLGIDGQGNIYFTAYFNSNEQKLYKSDGSTLVDMTPDGGPWTTIFFSDTDGEGNAYFRIYSSFRYLNLYKSDGNILVNLTSDGGPWTSIFSYGIDGQGSSYFLISSTFSDRKLYKTDGRTLEDITPDGGPWNNMYSLGTDVQGNKYFRIYSNPSDQNLYKSNGSTLVDITPDGGPWTDIDDLATDEQGNSYFLLNSSTSDKKLYKSDGSTLVEITPSGGPWSDISFQGTDGQGNSYFTIYSNTSDQKLYKSGSSSLEDVTPNGGPWSSILSQGTDGQGTNYFTVYSNTSDQKIYKSDGNTLEDITLDGGPWAGISSRGTDRQGNISFVVFSRSSADQQLFFYQNSCPNPTLSVVDATLVEGDEGAQNMTFEIALNTAASSDLQITCTTSDFTAFAGQDYTAVDKIITIPAGSLNTTVSVPIRGDVFLENNEQFYFSVRILPAATTPMEEALPDLKDGLALGHILNDDFVNDQTTEINSFSICGNQLVLNGTQTQGGEMGTWVVLHSTMGAGVFSDPNSFSAIYTGLDGSADSLLWTIQVNNTVLHQDTVIITLSPDSDNDGVQDCLDACLGSDDTQDEDGDGAPDDCDCNPTNAGDSFVNVDAVGDQTLFQSSNRLLSNATIRAGADITFQAGQMITLTKDFHAEIGSQFLAKIVPCHNATGEVFKTEDAPKMEITSEIKASNSTNTTTATDILDERSINLTVQPNPMHQAATIGIELPTNTTISLSLYELNGQLLKNLIRTTEQVAGQHHFSLQVGYLPSGMYLLQLQSATKVITKKVMVQR